MQNQTLKKTTKMNTIYKSILVLSLGLVTVTTSAQNKKDKEDDLTRQVLLERDYNPTLNEATKITTAPNIFTPKSQSASGVKFLDQAPQLTIGATKLGQVASGDIRTDVPFSKERFYLNFGAGSHGSIDGAIGVRAVDTKNDKLDISGAYVGMDGNVDYAHSKRLLNKVKAKYSDAKAGVKYQHTFLPSILTIGGSYQNTGFNYYGNPFSPVAQLDLIDLKTKQKVDVISFGAGLKSSDKNDGALKYDANLVYTNFSSKYGFMPSIDKGPRGGIIDANVDLYTALGDGNLGFEASILNQTFGSKNNYSINGAGFKGYTNFGISPYYKLEDTAWDLTLGLNLNYVNDDKNKFVFAPNILAQIHINDVNTLYAGATGGVNNNTFIDILQENRYVNPMSRVMYSRTPFDLKVGFKSGVIPNLEFDIFGGYKQVKDDHLYSALSLTDVSGKQVMWSNLATPMYTQVSTGHFGGLVSTKLIPMTTLTAKAVGYFYNVKNMDEAWGRPSFTAELTADFQPIDKLTVSLNYLLMSGRKGHNMNATFDSSIDPTVYTFSPANTASMKDINEFNARAEYQIIKQLSIHARVNNIFGQKYEQQFGYTLQGINVLGGFNVKF